MNKQTHNKKEGDSAECSESKFCFFVLSLSYLFLHNILFQGKVQIWDPWVSRETKSAIAQHEYAKRCGAMCFFFASCLSICFAICLILLVNSQPARWRSLDFIRGTFSFLHSFLPYLASDRNCQLRSSVGTAGPAPELSGHCRASVGAARPQPRAPDLSARVRENVRIDARKNARSDVRIECQIECQKRMSENICHIYTSKWDVRNCDKIICHDGDHSK